MFYFHSLDGSTVSTRKRLCVFGTFCAVWLCFDCFWRLVHCWCTVGTVLVDLWRLVHQWFWVFLTIGSVYHSSKTVKDSQKTVKTAKMTIVVPIVTCLHRVRRIHKAAQTPLPCETSMTRAWAVATARRPWARLTVCVYMDVHASGSHSLPRAATLSSTYWWCLQLV